MAAATPVYCSKCNTRLSASTGRVKHEIGTMAAHTADRCSRIATTATLNAVHSR